MRAIWTRLRLGWYLYVLIPFAFVRSMIIFPHFREYHITMVSLKMQVRFYETRNALYRWWLT